MNVVIIKIRVADAKMTSTRASVQQFDCKWCYNDHDDESMIMNVAILKTRVVNARLELRENNIG